MNRCVPSGITRYVETSLTNRPDGVARRLSRDSNEPCSLAQVRTTLPSADTSCSKWCRSIPRDQGGLIAGLEDQFVEDTRAGASGVVGECEQA